MHHHDDIFYAVHACIAMHNMMVEMQVNEDREESISFYEVVNVSDMPASITAIDPIVQELEVEDAQLAEQEGVGLLDIDNDVVYLNAREKWNRSRLYSQRFRTVQKRWEKLTSPEAHQHLQNAVKKHMYCQRYGSLSRAEEIPLFDPAEL